MDLQLLQQAPGFGRNERLIQSSGSVGVEVVHHQDDLLSVGIVEVYQLLYALCPVELGAALGDTDVPPASQRLVDDEQVGRTFSDVLIVVTCSSSRAGGKRLSYLACELLALLVQAPSTANKSVGTVRVTPPIPRNNLRKKNLMCFLE